MNTAVPPKREGLWDRLGCWASSACAAHCLAASFLFLLIPAFADVWAHPASHPLTALLAIPLALTVLVAGYRRDRVRWVLGATLAGIACIVVGGVLPYLPTSEGAAAGGAAACDAGFVADDAREPPGSQGVA